VLETEALAWIDQIDAEILTLSTDDGLRRL
jgi:hypothetical protein